MTSLPKERERERDRPLGWCFFLVVLSLPSALGRLSDTDTHTLSSQGEGGQAGGEGGREREKHRYFCLRNVWERIYLWASFCRMKST